MSNVAPHPVSHIQPQGHGVVTPVAAATQVVPANAANDGLPVGTPGVDPFDFVKADRIQVKDGSLFIDGYLVLHPHELAPENEAKLTKKLELTYSMNNPSFYESKDRLAVALNLGQLIPVSLASKHSKLQDLITSYNSQVDSGTDTELQRLSDDKQHPFATIVRDTIARPAQDPIGIETLKNGLGLYLLMREKMTTMGYRNGLATYVMRANTPDQVLTDLGDKIGVTPLQVRDAALKGGIDGVGQLLQLDPAYVNDVKHFVEYDAKQEFSLNAIEHWHQGRHLLGIAAPIPQKIATGMHARIEKTIANARDRVHHYYEVPDPIRHEEEQVAQAMNVLEPIQRALMYKLGYEICFTPEMMTDGIAFYPGIYGLHRKAANDLHDDLHSTNRIYFAGRGDMKQSWRVLAHEAAHLLKPELFAADEVKVIDTLADSDKLRFAKLNKMMDEKFTEFSNAVKSYQVATPEQKVALQEAVTQLSAPYGVDVAPVMPYLQNAQEFLFLVKHANDTLQVEGARYAKSGYNGTNERCREVISRFAELKQVEYAAQPQLLHFVAPGLDQIWEAHYIPHLKRIYQGLPQHPASAATQLHATPAEAIQVVPVTAANDAQVLPKVDQRPNLEAVTATTPNPALVTTLPETPVSVEPPRVSPPQVQPTSITPAPVTPIQVTPTGTSPSPETPISVEPPMTQPTPIAPAPVTSIQVTPAGTTPSPDYAINGAQHEGKVSEQAIAAMNALNGMGIQPQR